MAAAAVTPATAASDGGGLGGDFVVEAVQALRQRAVHVEPPVADEVRLEYVYRDEN